MTDLISTPPSPASPLNSNVAVDGWFPAIDCNSVRDALRLGEGIVPHARLVSAIEGAILTALRQLADWRSAHAANGITALANVPDNGLMIGGRPRAVVLWNRIVRFYAAAEIGDGHRDLIATDQAAGRADDAGVTADQYRRMGHHAVADLLSIGAGESVPRNMVELI